MMTSGVILFSRMINPLMTPTFTLGHHFLVVLIWDKRIISTKEMYKTIWRSIDLETKNETFCAVLKHIYKLQTPAEVDKWTVLF